MQLKRLKAAIGNGRLGRLPSDSMLPSGDAARRHSYVHSLHRVFGSMGRLRPRLRYCTKRHTFQADKTSFWRMFWNLLLLVPKATAHPSS